MNEIREDLFQIQTSKAQASYKLLSKFTEKKVILKDLILDLIFDTSFLILTNCSLLVC